MQAVIARIMWTWTFVAQRAAATSQEVKTKITAYLQPLFDGGATDQERLAVFGLAVPRQPQLVPVRIRRQG